MHQKIFNILSLGAGVQSTCLLLMSIKDLLPKLDSAIFADTGFEPPEVYNHLSWLKGFSEENGIPVHICQKGKIHEDYFNNKRHASIPFFISQGAGKDGILPRACTSEYKIEPLEQYIKREILGLKPRKHVPKDIFINQWIGISMDERKRAKPPRRKLDNRPRT